MNYLKFNGYSPRIVEHYNHYGHVRQDLYGFIDIVALHPDVRGVVGVQTTTGSNINARVEKAKAIPECLLWLKCGNWLGFHGWQKVKNLWQIRVIVLMLNPDDSFFQFEI